MECFRNSHLRLKCIINKNQPFKRLYKHFFVLVRVSMALLWQARYLRERAFFELDPVISGPVHTTTHTDTAASTLYFPNISMDVFSLIAENFWGDKASLNCRWHRKGLGGDGAVFFREQLDSPIGKMKLTASVSS